MSKILKIAVIGAGFAGLSAAWHLAQSSLAGIVIFDGAGIGGGASGIAAGLLHPFGGPRGHLNTKGYEGLEATLQLIHEASEILGKPVAKKTGLYRIPTSSEQMTLFRKSVELNTELSFESFFGYEALFIPNAFVVDSPLYLQGLWKSCEACGVEFRKEYIYRLDELNTFDRILIAAGGATKSFSECEKIPLRTLKGQILEASFPSPLRFSVPLTTDAYVVPTSDNRCIIGATYERQFEGTEPNLEQSKLLLLPRVASHFPEFLNASMLACKAGIRATAPNYFPYCRQVTEKAWVATGLGSKGLLYHGLLGKEAANFLLS